MSIKEIDYQKIIQESVKNSVSFLIRKLLEEISDNAIKNYFKIKFCTTKDGVIISEDLKKLYPKEMTIILQNQYEDLEVQNNHFSVTLSFQGKKENITIPFLSINKFCDPHNGFTLEMEDDYETDTKKNYKDNVINLFNKKIEGNSDDKY